MTKEVKQKTIKFLDSLNKSFLSPYDLANPSVERIEELLKLKKQAIEDFCALVVASHKQKQVK